MKLFFNSMRVKKLKGHKATKEMAHQLMWALENDLELYASKKNLKLDFQVLPSCIVYVQILLLKENGDPYEKYGIDAFDVYVLWIEYKDILWTILNYQSEIKRAKERIDYVYEKIREFKNTNS